MILTKTCRNIVSLALFLAIAAAGCSKKDTIVEDVLTPLPAVENTKPSADVMMQGFYWDVTPGGVWWNTLNTKLDDWKAAGINTIWLPVVSKAQSGQYSMGYDPFDYFDFGQYDQHGTVETRFGSYTELKSLIGNAKGKGFKLIADIVLNHNSGGDLEYSPYSKVSYYTRFSPKSGKFNRTFEDFHPNALHTADEGSFGQFPDLCHDRANVQDWLYNRPDGVGKFYRDSLGFDGWRFDYVKGFSPVVVKAWNAAVGGISIGEYYDGDIKLVSAWVAAANSSAFDFPLYFAMDAAFDNQNMLELDGKGLMSVNPSNAYTFVSNHDTEEISMANRLKAYAYILTSQGHPVIFYSDYESNLDKSKLVNLIWIHNNLAAGTSTRLYADKQEFIFRRNGTPGLVAYINNSSQAVSRKVQTSWANTVIKDYTGVNNEVKTDGSGNAQLTCAASSYAVYAPK
jgi:alpha-amylase